MWMELEDFVLPLRLLYNDDSLHSAELQSSQLCKEAHSFVLRELNNLVFPDNSIAIDFNLFYSQT